MEAISLWAVGFAGGPVIVHRSHAGELQALLSCSAYYSGRSPPGVRCQWNRLPMRGCRPVPVIFGFRHHPPGCPGEAMLPDSPTAPQQSGRPSYLEIFGALMTPNFTILATGS